jgi:hypothetical protein
MRPVVYSKQSKKGWIRCGSNIRYYRTDSRTLNPIDGSNNTYQEDNNDINPNPTRKKSLSSMDPEYYSLSFTYVIEKNDDICYFAYAIPYTYSDLQSVLYQLQVDSKRNQFLKRKLLCKTIAGNGIVLNVFSQIVLDCGFNAFNVITYQLCKEALSTFEDDAYHYIHAVTCCYYLSLIDRCLVTCVSYRASHPLRFCPLLVDI